MKQRDNENQQNNKNYEIDSRVFNFLIRRIIIEEPKYDILAPIKVVTYSFEGYPDYGFNSFTTKYQIEGSIISLLSDNEIVDIDLYANNNKLNPEIQKIIRTIRRFLNIILK